MKYKKYPRYKDSGIEWLGEIPEHWEVIKGKFLFRAGMGNTILKENLNENGKYPVYSATENNDIFGYIDNPSLILNKGDLVIPARGNSIGHIKIIETTSTATQTTIYCKILNKNKLSPKYIFYS
jgi:type I restriction enzyme S subunit